MRRPLDGVRRTDLLIVRQPHGIDSRSEIYLPRARPRGFVIVHGGHTDVEDELRSVMQPLVRRGFVVAAMNMPLVGRNPRPAVRVRHHGRLVLTRHDLLELLGLGPGGTLALFLDPVRAVTAAASRMGFRTVSMVGLSGGGWTTVVSAALDPRIRRSFQVAGSVPTYLKSDPKNQGDIEQEVPGFYALADYQDLYALGALEPGRSQLQVFNDQDPCCFALTAVPGYVRDVRAALRRVSGGHFAAAVVHNADHSVAPATRAVILRRLGA
jgi:dienelactone hydrolase